MKKRIQINYLDLAIINRHNHLTFDTYEKSTFTDLTVHNDPCQPHEYKKSAINYLISCIRS